MTLEINTMSRLVNSLPARFPFYHLGDVEMTPVSQAIQTDLPNLKELIDDNHAVGFMLQGDLKALLIVAFPRGLDVPTYTELGNILASRLATRMSDEEGLEVLITPPISLNESHIEMLPRLSTLISQRSYRHCNNEVITEIKTVLLASTNGLQGKGNA